MYRQNNERTGLVPDVSVVVVVAVILAFFAFLAIGLTVIKTAGDAGPRGVTIWDNLACVIGPIECESTEVTDACSRDVMVVLDRSEFMQYPTKDVPGTCNINQTAQRSKYVCPEDSSTELINKEVIDLIQQELGSNDQVGVALWDDDEPTWTGVDEEAGEAYWPGSSMHLRAEMNLTDDRDAIVNELSELGYAETGAQGGDVLHSKSLLQFGVEMLMNNPNNRESAEDIIIIAVNAYREGLVEDSPNQEYFGCCWAEVGPEAEGENPEKIPDIAAIIDEEPWGNVEKDSARFRKEMIPEWTDGKYESDDVEIYTITYGNFKHVQSTYEGLSDAHSNVPYDYPSTLYKLVEGEQPHYKTEFPDRFDKLQNVIQCSK